MKFKHKKFYLAYTLEFTVIIFTLLNILKQFSFINTGDGFNQNYLFVVYIGKYLRSIAINFLHGNFVVPQFDFAIGLGEGIIPALNCYGFGDPFMLISAAFPAKYSAYAYTVIILSKIYLSGIGFIYYCRKRECKEKNILLGVPLYIAGQYVIYHGIMHSPTFFSIMISLPFICAGIDEVILTNGDKKVKISKCLVLAVAFQALNGFFTLYMELLFAALYALINLLFRVNGVLAIIKKGCCLFLQVILGMLISGVIFIPAIYGYVSSARSGEFQWIGWKALFQLSANTSWEALSSIVIPAGHQEIGLMLSVVSVFLICLAIKRNKAVKEMKILLFILLALYINMSFASWVAGGFTAAYYYGRWTFCVLFVAAFFTVLGGEYIEELSLRTWFVFFGMMFMYIVLLATLEKRYFSNAKSDVMYHIYFSYGILVLGMTVVFSIVYKFTSNKAGVRYYLILVSIVAGSLLNIYTLFEAEGAKWYLKTYESVRNEILASNAGVYSLDDESFGRLDVQGNARNESLYYGYFSANEYLSMINSNIVDFYQQYALVAPMYGSVHHLIGLEGRSGIEDLLSVEFYDDAKKENVVENTDYLPMGVTFDKYIAEEDAEHMNVVAKNAYVLEHVILDQNIEGLATAEIPEIDKEGVVSEEKLEIEYINLQTENNMFSVTPESKIIISINNEKGGECYFHADKFILQGGGTNSVGHIKVGENGCEIKGKNAQYTNGVENMLMCLGKLPGGRYTFEITFNDSAVYEISEMHVYMLDMDKMKAFNEERQKETVQNISIDIDRVTGIIETDSKKVLFLSIPYSNGWKAYINGEKTKIYRADYGFMALELNQGTNEFCLKYTTPGILPGFICSIISIIIFILLCKKNGIRQESES